MRTTVDGVIKHLENPTNILSKPIVGMRATNEQMPPLVILAKHLPESRGDNHQMRGPLEPKKLAFASIQAQMKLDNPFIKSNCLYLTKDTQVPFHHHDSMGSHPTPHITKIRLLPMQHKSTTRILVVPLAGILASH